MANVPYQSYKPAAPDPATIIRTDTIDGVQYQIVKIDIGAAGASVPLKADGMTRSLVTIEYEHHELHDGSMFRAGEEVALANNATRVIHILTPKLPNGRICSTAYRTRWRLNLSSTRGRRLREPERKSHPTTATVTA